jgi:tRNA1(Val) A37 N6-methylase TrmN6
MFSLPLQQPVLAREDRRATGVYYTPPEIARLIAERSLRELRSPHPSGRRGGGSEGEKLRILDPACGAGELLLAARDALGSRTHELCGIDIDPIAVNQARQRVSLSGSAAEQVRLADALEGDAFPLASFDIVIGNPPYVSIRELARQRSRADIQRLKERFRTARGNFDLYVLFIERALEWLRPGGRCGLIVPNKWATLDYARACRELLLEQATIEEVIDLSEHRVFRQASVYPHVLIFSKQPAVVGHEIAVRDGGFIRQSSLSADAFAFEGSFAIESQVATQPLGEFATLQCGTPGYAAAKIGGLLQEAEDADSPALPFITSGNIDRYRVRPGNVRYMNRVWREPRLPVDAAALSARQKKLFSSPKIVIAGMSRRIEAAWDAEGVALGVQVFAAADCHLDPFYLLALLNSKLLSYLFRTRFAAKRLAGGYLAVNKGQLAKLPIVAGSLRAWDRQRIETLSELAAALSLGDSHQAAASEIAIDRLVYELYQLTPQQIAAVERHFAEFSSIARLAA